MMKENIFNQYVDSVINRYGITRGELFDKVKEPVKADARHLLYYLCSKRGIRNTYIQKHMGNNGLFVEDSNIVYGIRKFESMVKDDRDVRKIVKEITEECAA